MKIFVLDKNFRSWLWLILAFSVLIRVVAMVVIPLTDTTEARYGEIARKMVETNNWVTLQHDYGVPFWAKPPLSTWLSAGSMKLFGVTEGAARLPSLLLGLSIVYMILRLGRYRHNKDVGLLSSVILFTMPLFYLAAGTVMTDMALVFSVSLCFVSFWITITTDNKSERGRYGWLFFVGLGLGLLAKGPICGVMTLFPILFWVLKSNHNLLSIWQKIPWIKGTILMLLIAVPWYVLSEQSTPGFLKYFLLGEHFYRFLVPGWSGDLYGFAHQQPLGTVWLFWVAAVLPWSLVLSWWLITKYRVIPSLFKDQDGWLWYLFLWAIWPMIFFTFSRNIIWPYVITSLPASALLIAELLYRYRDHKKRVSVTKYSYWLWVPLLMSAFSLSGVVAISSGTTMGQYTQKPLIQEYVKLRPSEKSKLYYLFRRYSSAEFYSLGKAKYSNDTEVLNTNRSDSMSDFFVVHDEDVDRIPRNIFSHYVSVGSSNGNSLYMERPNEVSERSSE